jgi:predicted tellurium resistance membrane protein TerC
MLDGAWLELVGVLALLLSLEVLLGLQNAFCIDLWTRDLRQHERIWVRPLGQGIAVVLRLVLVFVFLQLGHLKWDWVVSDTLIMTLRDLVVVAAGVFLMFRGWIDLSAKDPYGLPKRTSGYVIKVLLQVATVSFVFSLDALAAAVSLTDDFRWILLSVLGGSFVVIVGGHWLRKIFDWVPALRTVVMAFLVLLGLAVIGKSLNFWEEMAWLYPVLLFGIVLQVLDERRRKREALRRNLQEIDA